MSPRAHAALAALLLLGCDKKTPATPPEAPSTAQRPDDTPVWIAPDAPVTRLTLTAQGPSMAHEQAAPLLIAPTLAGGAEPWSIDHDAMLHATRWHTGQLTQRWEITPGDPTLRATLALDAMPTQATEQPLTLTLSLPPGELDVIDDTMSLAHVQAEAATHAWTPGWLRWRSGEQVVTFVHSGGERMEIKRDEAGITLSWTLWSPELHPLLKGCEAQITGWSLDARWEVTLGDRAPVIPSRLPGGFQAAIAPVFISPALTGRKDLRESDATSAQDWLARARTLIHGHSASTDPRFGNGGLLGGQLGGTLSAPAKIAADISVMGYAKGLPEQVEIAAENAAEASTALFTGQPSCANLATPGATNTPVALALGGVTSKLPDMLTSAPGVSSGAPLTVTVPALNGQRSTLTTSALSRPALQQLQRQRGLAWFTTPLVATRNPLVAAAQEALLEPERQGHWTLHPELTAALGEIELLQESETLLFAPVGMLMRRWRAAQRVAVSPLPDGSWLLHNPGAPIPDFTLISPEPSLLTTPPGAQDKLTGDGAAQQRWIWLALPTGFTRILATAPPIAPVRWQLTPL
jgi:hypothetical protein